MPTTPSDTFTFRQKTIQNEGGWCSGISSVLINEATGDGLYIPSPEDAFDVFRRICAAVSSDLLTTQAETMLRRFKKGQRTEDMGGCFGIRNPSGWYAYNFSGYGAALLNLEVSNTTSIWVYGAWFQWRTSTTCFTSLNHAGAVVWSPKEIFVFDPNVGGSIWPMPGVSFSSLFRYSVPARIDEALAYMYGQDPQNRHRRSRVKSAAIVKQGSKKSMASRVLSV